MATNNVNIINITNLPQAQDIVDGNFLVVQNDLGTQIIDWADVYVLKTDVNGNGTLLGTLTAAGARIENCSIDSLSAEYVVTNGLPGQSYTDTYFNKFTFTNGVATSARYASGSPEYEDLTTNVIPAATAYAVSLTQGVYEAYSTTSGTIVAGADSYSITFNVALPSQLSTGDFQSADCNVIYTGTFALSSNPYVGAFTDLGSSLGATLYLKQLATGAGLALSDFSIKISKHYTV